MRGGGTARKTPEGWHTLAGAQELTGIPLATLRRWRMTGKFTPAGYSRHGAITVYLYSDTDIKQLQKLRPEGRETKGQQQ